MRLRVFRDGPRLMAQVQGQPAFEPLARTPRSLFIVASAVRLDFKPADGQARQMTLFQGPVRRVLKRP